MARKSAAMPITGGGSGAGGRALSVLVAIFVLAMVLRDPSGAAAVVRDGLAFTHDAIAAMSTFGRAVTAKG